MICKSPRYISILFSMLIASCSQHSENSSILSESVYSVDNPESINTVFTYNALTNEPLVSSVPNASNSNSAQSIAPKQLNQFRGIVSITAGNSRLQLCNSKANFILEADPKLIQQLQRRSNQDAYVEFEGSLTASLQPEDSNNAKITVTQLHYLTANTNKCLFPVSKNQFELIGRNPAWYGSSDEHTFSFKVKDIDSKWNINKSVITKGANALVNTTNQLGEQLDITFSGKGCTDNKNNFWQYETRINIKGRRLRGCGKYPNAYPETQNWQGEYSYSNAKVSVNLQLDKQLKASAIYTYSNGRKVLETGYWHLFGSTGLKLVFTHRQGLPISKEFQFKREGDSLYTKQQWQHNKQYSYQNAAISFNPVAEDQQQVTTNQQQITTKESLNSRVFTPISMKSPTIANNQINAAVKKYFTMHQTDYKDSKYLYSEFDLNGDGNKELLVLLDWCQDAGCVLLVFENQKNRYRFTSRITQVKTPIQVSNKQSQQWQSLLLKSHQEWRLVDYNGISYPSDSSLGSIPMQRDFSGVKLIDNPLSNNWGIRIN